MKIQLNAITLTYNDSTTVLEDNTITLETTSQQSKLYGLIGPSGTGKTTLISILGGQLHPQKGDVLVDGVEIYSVSDHTRRELIAMQLQTSTSLRGKLSYNLRFGLPRTEDPEEIYDDDKLITTLKQVGLWSLFADKDGLNTLIGEGGLNLSGGQRQRLNFANLYLRAKYYQPKMILIDEPTSSLDEISEKAITKMIIELSQKAVTIVVAHRLNTLDEAVALLDSSMFAKHKNLTFVTKPELQKISQYYKDLLTGKAVLEE